MSGESPEFSQEESQQQRRWSLIGIVSGVSPSSSPASQQRRQRAFIRFVTESSPGLSAEIYQNHHSELMFRISGTSSGHLQHKLGAFLSRVSLQFTTDVFGWCRWYRNWYKALVASYNLEASRLLGYNATTPARTAQIQHACIRTTGKVGLQWFY